MSSLLAEGEPQSAFPNKSSEDIPGCVSSLLLDGCIIDGPDYYYNAPVKNQRMGEQSGSDVYRKKDNHNTKYGIKSFLLKKNFSKGS